MTHTSYLSFQKLAQTGPPPHVGVSARPCLFVNHERATTFRQTRDAGAAFISRSEMAKIINRSEAFFRKLDPCFIRIMVPVALNNALLRLRIFAIPERLIKAAPGSRVWRKVVAGSWFTRKACSESNEAIFVKSEDNMKVPQLNLLSNVENHPHLSFPV